MTNNLEQLKADYKKLGETIERMEDGSKPEEGARYFTVSYGEICYKTWDNDTIDNSAYKTGNIYRTRELAERARDRLILIEELKDFADFVTDWNDHSQDKYRLYYDHLWGRWGYMSSAYSQNAFILPHFPTVDRIEEAIEHFGDRLNLLLEG